MPKMKHEYIAKFSVLGFEQIIVAHKKEIVSVIAGLYMERHIVYNPVYIIPIITCQYK
jgi:uncharacterized MAPEG superfamily protein